MTVPSSVLAPKVTPLPLSQVRRQISGDFCCWCAIDGQHLLVPLPGTNIFVPGRPLFLLVFYLLILFGIFLVQSLSEIRLNSTWRLHCQLTPQGILLEEILKVCLISPLTLKKSIGGD